MMTFHYKSLVVKSPRLWVLVGSEKTTLLRLMGGQLKPESGAVVFDNQDITQLSRKDLYIARRKMGMLFQSGALFYRDDGV